MKIIKRDGRKVDFDGQKIMDAILKAFFEVDSEITEYAEDKAYNIALYIENESKTKELTIEEIQDLVEKGLMSTKRKDVAKAYVIYRNERNKERERNSNLIKTISEKITASNVQNQNANVDEKSFGGRMGEANSATMRKYALNYCLSDMAKNNHLNNEVYIHDLDHYAVGDHNCLSILFDDLLANGFNTRQADIRPANSVNTAFQLVAVIFQLQSLQQFGGVSATHLDWTMVPYVRKSFCKHYQAGLKYFNPPIENSDNTMVCFKGKEVKLSEMIDVLNISITDTKVYHNSLAHKYAMDMTKRETQQAVEAMYHNLNTLQSRSGN